MVRDFVYLGSTISDTLSLDTDLNRRIGKASTTMSSLTKRVWKNRQITENPKIQVYRACVLSTLLYGSESWVLHARHEHKLNPFHLAWTWPGKTKFPTLRFLREQICQACTLYWDSDSCDGWDMFLEWRKAESQRTFCMVNRRKETAPRYQTATAIQRHL